MALAYSYRLTRQENGWLLVCFPDVPEALTEGETEGDARTNAVDCLIVALDGYVKAGRRLPKVRAGHPEGGRAELPSAVVAKLAAYDDTFST